jgi:hypothetical protein
MTKLKAEKALKASTYAPSKKEWDAVEALLKANSKKPKDISVRDYVVRANPLIPTEANPPITNVSYWDNNNASMPVFEQPTYRSYFAEVDPNEERNKEDEEEDRRRSSRKSDLSSTRDRDNYINNIKRIYQLYIETKNVIYLYKVILNHFEQHLHRAWGWNPDPQKKHLIPLDDSVRQDCDNLISSLEGAGLVIDNDAAKDITVFLTSQYSGEIYHKRVYVGILTLDMYNDLIYKLISKGVVIDPEISENIKSIDFNELLYNGEILTLNYLIPLNTILFHNIRDEGVSDSLMGLGFLYKTLNELPTVIESKELGEDNIILIDGSQFSKSAFESMVESSYDNFMGNLKLETLIENKDIADNSVVENVELKLL